MCLSLLTKISDIEFWSLSLSKFWTLLTDIISVHDSNEIGDMIDGMHT